MPARNTIEIVINAKDNASGTLQNITGSLQSIGGAALSATVGGLAAASAAIGAFAIQGVNAFTSFQQGISEVFTLLPGITEGAMSQMESEVQRFMNTTGRMSEETLPALYQALSAGVPQENVFTFLELANQAAIGGVTDLETAVDGITSVINAYGSDVLSAQQASDLMFTAVRLGKTDFEQLSQSLFNVVPVASAVGVGFSDITAGLATITAQGVPTSVATTQLRQLFVELADTGTEVGQIFETVAGQSFSEFIAAGNTTADALGLLAAEAEATGVPLQQMFGSIEAGQAALALTGTNMQTFIDNTNAMANSAGATNTAFEQMNDTMQQSVNIFRARFQSMLISAGRLIVPFIQPLVDIFSVFFAIIEAGLVQGETMSDWLGHLPGFLRPIGVLVGQVSAFFFNLSNAFASFIAMLEQGYEPLTAISILLGVFLGQNTASLFINIVIGIQDIISAVTSAISPVLDWLGTWISIQDVMVALGIAIASVVIPAIISVVAALAPVIAVFAAVVVGVALLRNAWETNFLGMRDAILSWIPALQSGLTAAVNFFTGLWDAFQQGGFSGAGNFVLDNLITPLVNNLITGFQNIDWSNVVSTLFTLWGTALNLYITGQQWIFNNIVTPVFTKLIEVISNTDWNAVGTAIMDGIAFGLSALFDFVSWINETFLQPFLANAQTAIETIDWFAVGEGIINAIGFALTATFDFVAWIIDSLMSPITSNTDAATGQVDWSGVGTAILNAIGGFLSNVFDFVLWLSTNVLLPLISGAATAISNTDWSGVGQGIMNSIASALPNIANWVSTNIIAPARAALSNFNPLAGFENGGGNPLGGNPILNAGASLGNTLGAVFRQFGGFTSGPTITGERGRELFIPSTSGTIIPNDQTEALLGNKQPVTVNFYYSGSLSDREAREGAKKVVDELTALGVPITGN